MFYISRSRQYGPVDNYNSCQTARKPRLNFTSLGCKPFPTKVVQKGTTNTVPVDLVRQHVLILWHKKIRNLEPLGGRRNVPHVTEGNRQKNFVNYSRKCSPPCLQAEPLESLPGKKNYARIFSLRSFWTSPC